MIASYAITDPFLEHLSDEGEQELAREAYQYTVRRMDAREDSQLTENLAKRAARLEVVGAVLVIRAR